MFHTRDYKLHANICAFQSICKKKTENVRKVNYILEFWRCLVLTKIYICMRGGPHAAPAPRPSLIYCASPLFSPLLIPHFEWNVGLYLITKIIMNSSCVVNIIHMKLFTSSWYWLRLVRSQNYGPVLNEEAINIMTSLFIVITYTDRKLYICLYSKGNTL
jgi:hypothetical protein